jgi:CRP-like cAMP-binding protein
MSEKNCAICANLDEVFLKKIAGLLRVIQIERGSIIYDQEQDSEAFYVISKGEVKLSKLSAQGKEFILKVAHSPEPLGCYSFFGTGKYTERAEAVSEVTLLRVPKKEFLSLLNQDQQLNFNFLEAISSWLNTMNMNLERISFSSAEDRVLSFFAQQDQPWKKELVFTMKKQEMAALLNMRPETFSRALKTLEEHNKIQLTEKGIIIL